MEDALDVHIITVDRSVFADRAGNPAKNTLQATLHSLSRSDFPGTPRLFIGAEGVGHVPDSHPPDAIDRLNPQELEALSSWGVHRRATYNYWRALAQAAGDLILVEDDVLFAPNWYPVFNRTKTAIEHNVQEYVLALYCHYDDTLDFTGLFGPYRTAGFFGTQGMYYPSAVRVALARYLHDHGVDSGRAPYDLLIKDFCRETGVPLFACRRSLVQHAAPFGSTGLGGGHVSVSFLADDVDPMAPVSMRHLRPARRPGWWLRSNRGEHYLAAVGEAEGIYVNESAALVWELIDGVRTGNEIADQIVQLFPEHAAAIPREVEQVLEWFLDHGAIQVAAGR